MSLIIKSGGREVAARKTDEPLLAAIQAAGIPIEASCGGRGVCGRCSVFLEHGTYKIFDETVEVNSGERREELACVTRVASADARVAVPRQTFAESAGARIETEIVLPEFKSNPAVHRGEIVNGSAVKRALGIAVDIGTSTVVAALVDCETGNVIDRASRFNQQVLRADDVASRIAQCGCAENVRALQQLVIAHTINPLIEEICERNDLRPEEIFAAAIAGNTTMSHLFLGLSPFSIGTLPFTPVARKYPEIAAAKLGLRVHPAAPVFVVPCASGYVGGDIVADIHVTGLPAQSGLCLLADIGTNGEMALAENGKILACATAAGPAFEGAGLLHGCRAISGAIEHIEFEKDLHFRCKVIGDSQPVGFCGSAAIDFIACGMESELINTMGRFDIDLLKSRGRYKHVRVRNGWSHGCCVVDGFETSTGEPLVITELDVSQILKAKAAIYAGLKTMMHLRGKHPRDLDRVILAGGFAKHIRLANAIKIGLLPPVAMENFEIVGNGSLAGAVLALADTTSRDAYAQLIDAPEIVELNLVPEFATFFADALALPYLEPEEFEDKVAT